MRNVFVGIVACFSAASLFAAAPKTDDQKMLYVLGQLLARNIAPFELSKEEAQFVLSGFTDGVTGGKAAIDEKIGPTVNEWVSKRMTAIADNEKKKSKDFLAKVEKEPGMKKGASGYFFKVEKEGNGQKPKVTDKVKVHYHGTLIDGKVFDSSVDRKEPAVFGLDRVIPCWQQGIQEMSVGGKMKLYCPSELAYGDRGSPPNIKGGSALIFNVELLSIEKPEPKPAAPTAPQTPLVLPPKK